MNPKDKAIEAYHLDTRLSTLAINSTIVVVRDIIDIALKAERDRVDKVIKEMVMDGVYAENFENELKQRLRLK